MTTTTDSLQSAISHLGAVEVAPGRYAYRSLLTASPYFVAEGHIIAAYFAGSIEAIQPATMPKWWTPERRYAVRNINTGKIVPDAVLRDSPLAYQGVTADLGTGEIVAANLTNVPRSEIYGAKVPA